jgi:hypothetical protein
MDAPEETPSGIPEPTGHKPESYSTRLARAMASTSRLRAWHSSRSRPNFETLENAAPWRNAHSWCVQPSPVPALPGRRHRWVIRPLPLETSRSPRQENATLHTRTLQQGTILSRPRAEDAGCREDCTFFVYLDRVPTGGDPGPSADAPSIGSVKRDTVWTASRAA